MCFFLGVLHFTLSVYVKSSADLPLFVCLSLSPVPPSWAPSQDIFPPECPTHVGSMSVSSCPSPHHHHTLDALWLPLQCAAWRHQWVLPLWSQSPYLSPFSVVWRDLWFIAHLSLCCHHFLYSSNFTVHPVVWWKWLKPVMICHSSCCSDFVVDQTQAVKFALDIACGMAFLHTLEPMIPRHYLNSKSVMVRRSCGFSIAFRIRNVSNWPIKGNDVVLPKKHRKLQKKEGMSVAL